jgi:hypothetical protein
MMSLPALKFNCQVIHACIFQVTRELEVSPRCASEEKRESYPSCMCRIRYWRYDVFG